MFSPSAELFDALFTALLPTFFGLVGALGFGVLIGASYVPVADRADRKNDSGDTLRDRVRQEKIERRTADEDSAKRALESELSALSGQLVSLKMQLASARRGEALDKERRLTSDAATKPEAVRIAELEGYARRFPALLKEVEELRRATDEVPVAPVNGKTVIGNASGPVPADDLQRVDGIGPKIAEQLRKNGLRTWADVAATDPDRLREVLDEAGEHFHLHDPSSWPEQCKLMVENRWEELRKYQRKLSHAR